MGLFRPVSFTFTFTFVQASVSPRQTEDKRIIKEEKIEEGIVS
jgi:hypothetical protein